VSKHILPVLAEIGPVTAVCVNGWVIPPTDSPYTIINAPNDDLFNTENIKQHILLDDYDLLYLTGDINILYGLCDEIKARKSQSAKVVVYTAIDNDVFNLEYLEILKLADLPVVYSFYAQRVVREMDSTLLLDVIYHGCEPYVFRPLALAKREELRKAAFNIGLDTYLVACFNRNQLRKDLARTMYAFHMFHLKNPNSKLYMHCKQQDIGGCLPSQAYHLGLRVVGEDPEVVFCPPEFHEAFGVPREHMNDLYNCADLIMSTSTGEGWGLTTTEAMASGVPFVGPRNTTFIEILEEHEERGLLCDSGGPDLWYTHYGHSESPRELVSVTSMVSKLEQAYNSPWHIDKNKRAYAARKWTLAHTWSHKQDKWRQLLSRAINSIEEKVTL